MTISRRRIHKIEKMIKPDNDSPIIIIDDDLSSPDMRFFTDEKETEAYKQYRVQQMCKQIISPRLISFSWNTEDVTEHIDAFRKYVKSRAMPTN